MQRGFLLYSAVAVHAVDLNRVARLAVNVAISVIVLLAVAVRALHTLVYVNVPELNAFSELVLIVRRHHAILGIQHVALAVMLINRAKHPAVPMEIRELRVLQILVELFSADLFEKAEVIPEPARGGALGIRDPGLVTLLIGWVVLFDRIHMLAVALVVPPPLAQIPSPHLGAGVHRP